MPQNRKTFEGNLAVANKFAAEQIASIRDPTAEDTMIPSEKIKRRYAGTHRANVPGLILLSALIGSRDYFYALE